MIGQSQDADASSGGLAHDRRRALGAIRDRAVAVQIDRAGHCALNGSGGLELGAGCQVAIGGDRGFQLDGRNGRHRH